MTIPAPIDHVETGQSRLLSQWQDKPNMSGLVKSIMQSVQEVEDTIHQIIDNMNIFDATGEQLDVIGTLIGLERNGMDDDSYRAELFKQISINRSDGTTEIIISLMEAATQTTNSDFWEHYPASIFFLIRGGYFAKLKEILEAISQAGVRSLLMFDEGDCFVPSEHLYKLDLLIDEFLDAFEVADGSVEPTELWTDPATLTGTGWVDNGSGSYTHSGAVSGEVRDSAGLLIENKLYNISLTATTAAGGWDLTGAAYDSVSFSVAAQDGIPVAVFFKPDGTKMYTLGGTNDDAFQYTLSTPWDVSSASYDGVSFSFNAQSLAVTKIFFKPDGTKMYMVAATPDTVFQYTLATPWDLSTASYDSVSFSVFAQDSSAISIFFKDDGSKMYMMGTATRAVYQYTLATPWDIATASYDSVSFSVAAQDLTPNGMFFKPDGMKFFVAGSVSDSVHQYSLAVAWDLSTASSDGVSLSITAQETSINSVFFKPDGLKMYIIGATSDAVHQYSVSGGSLGTFDVQAGGTPTNGFNSLTNLGAGVHSIVLAAEDVATINAIRIISDSPGVTVHSISVREATVDLLAINFLVTQGLPTNNAYLPEIQEVVDSTNLWSDPAALGTGWADNGGGSYTHTASTAGELVSSQDLLEPNTLYSVEFVLTKSSSTGFVHFVAGGENSMTFPPASPRKNVLSFIDLNMVNPETKTFIFNVRTEESIEVNAFRIFANRNRTVSNIKIKKAQVINPLCDIVEFTG